MENGFTNYEVTIFKANGDIVEVPIEATDLLDMFEQIVLQYGEHLVNNNGDEVAKIEWFLCEVEDEFLDSGDDGTSYDADFLDKLWTELNKDGRDE